MNDLSRAYAVIAPHWPGLTSRKKPIGIKAVAAAVIWPRKPEPDLRKADLGALMRLSAVMTKSLEPGK
jgi:hypothetical protein